MNAQISAEVLLKMIQDAEEFLGEEITKAVITVPAYFNDEQVRPNQLVSDQSDWLATTPHQSDSSSR